MVMGPGCTLVGGIDPVAGVLRAEPTAVRAAAVDAFRRAGGRYCVAGGCEIPSRTPVEHLRMLCKPMAMSESGD
jgi:uroporphyrinogen-III decarboxylase